MTDRTFDLRLNLSDLGADFIIEAGDLAIDEGLETAVLLSLFCDQRANPEDVLPGGGEDLRGWWADAVADPSGSRLWLLAREKVTPAVAVQLRRAAEAALAWFVEDGIASKVTVSTVLKAAGNEARIDLEIVIERGTAVRWSSLWAAVASTTYPAPGVRLQLLPA